MAVEGGAAGPGPAPAAACPAPRPRRCRDSIPRAQPRSPGLTGRGGGEEAAGVGTAAEPPPERPLMKARPPSSACSTRRLRCRRRRRQGSRCPRIEALGAAWPLGRDLPQPGTEEEGHSERSRNEHQSLHHTSDLVQIESHFLAKTAVFHC